MSENLQRIKKASGIFCKTQWDAAQASAIGTNWGQVFAENIQDVLLKMLHGESDAFSEFVKKEHDRILSLRGLRPTGVLVAPGFPTSTDIGQGSD